MAITTPDWVKDAIFYQIFPDRFAKSDRIPDRGLKFELWDSPPTVYGFKGGDIFGICEHLDYLQDLGINSIYLNPITASASNHRYHTYDYYKIDPLLGGDIAFRQLLDDAHSRGMRIIMDGVFNHASRGFWQFHHVLENGVGSPYVDWFHFNKEYLQGIKNWGAYPDFLQQEELKRGISSFDGIGYQAWWNLPALPKFNTNTPAVREFIFNVAEHWLNFGVDGWRLDVPAEIDDDAFWMEFRHRVKNVNPEAYIVGEIWHESQRWLRGDQFDAVMNYLLTGALMGWLIGDRLPPYIFNVGEFRRYLNVTDARGFSGRIKELLNLYDPEINYVQFNLLDSHDTPRFLTLADNDIDTLKLAWLFLFTFVGAPCIYYGDEVGMAGGSDPECRGSFMWEKEKWNEVVYGYAKSIINLRTNHISLRRGEFRELYSAGNAYAYTRSTSSETLLVCLNAEYEPVTIDLPAPQGLPEQSLSIIFGELLGKKKVRVTNGTVHNITIPPRSGVVLG